MKLSHFNYIKKIELFSNINILQIFSFKLILLDRNNDTNVRDRNID
jgi:hypothetical protein